jgi:hypothetical protein
MATTLNQTTLSLYNNYIEDKFKNQVWQKDIFSFLKDGPVVGDTTSINEFNKYLRHILFMNGDAVPPANGSGYLFISPQLFVDNVSKNSGGAGVNIENLEVEYCRDLFETATAMQSAFDSQMTMMFIKNINKVIKSDVLAVYDAVLTMYQLSDISGYNLRNKINKLKKSSSGEVKIKFVSLSDDIVQKSKQEFSEDIIFVKTNHSLEREIIVRIQEDFKELTLGAATLENLLHNHIKMLMSIDEKVFSSNIYALQGIYKAALNSLTFQILNEYFLYAGYIFQDTLKQPSKDWSSFSKVHLANASNCVMILNNNINKFIHKNNGVYYGMNVQLKPGNYTDADKIDVTISKENPEEIINMYHQLKKGYFIFTAYDKHPIDFQNARILKSWTIENDAQLFDSKLSLKLSSPLQMTVSETNNVYYFISFKKSTDFRKTFTANEQRNELGKKKKEQEIQSSIQKANIQKFVEDDVSGLYIFSVIFYILFIAIIAFFTLSTVMNFSKDDKKITSLILLIITLLISMIYMMSPVGNVTSFTLGRSPIEGFYNSSIRNMNDVVSNYSQMKINMFSVLENYFSKFTLGIPIIENVNLYKELINDLDKEYEDIVETSNFYKHYKHSFNSETTNTLHEHYEMFIDIITIMMFSIISLTLFWLYQTFPAASLYYIIISIVLVISLMFHYFKSKNERVHSKFYNQYWTK